MKGIYKIVIVVIVLAIVIISAILIINYDNTRILQLVEYTTPHYSISKIDNKVVTVEYTQNMSPKIVTTYYYTGSKLTQREMKIFCDNKLSAKQLYKGLDNNNKFFIEKVTIDRNIVTTTLPEKNIPKYEAGRENLSIDELYDLLIQEFEQRAKFGQRACERIQE